MEDFMTIDQIVDAAEKDALRQKERGTLYHEDDYEWNGDKDNGENIYTLVSLYSQWAEDRVEAEDAIWTMFEKKFPEYLN